MEEIIRKIMAEAADKIIEEVKKNQSNNFDVERAAQSIEDTANKILLSSFEAKTFLLDENRIDYKRLEMLDLLTASQIDGLYESCLRWFTTGNIDKEYEDFCKIMSMSFGTNIHTERQKNVDTIIYKHKLIHGNDSGTTDGEAQT